MVLKKNNIKTKLPQIGIIKKKPFLVLRRKKSIYYNKILGSITKKGKKNLAKKALNNSLFIVSKICRLALLTKKRKNNMKSFSSFKQELTNKKLFKISKKYSGSGILPRMFSEMQCRAEIKKVVWRKKFVTLIPFPINKKRETYLKIKWFLKGIKENPSNISFEKKMIEEFFKIIEKPTYIKRERSKMYSLLIKNLSNSHFRWA